MQSRVQGDVIRVAGLALLFVLIAPSARSQDATAGTVSGTVRDPHGDPVSHAAVIVQNKVSGLQVRTGLSNAAGEFTLIQLLPATYSIQVMAPGFSSAVVDAVPVREAEATYVTAILDPTQKVGGAALRMKQAATFDFVPEAAVGRWHTYVQVGSPLTEEFVPEAAKPGDTLPNAEEIPVAGAPFGFLPEEAHGTR